MDVAVDQRRLREDIEANAAFGALDVENGRGRTVLTGTEANRRARERFVDRLEAAGFDVRVDAVGNVAGRWTPPSADPSLDPVAMGSHLDSVPEGGIFDGPLGVYGALEAVRGMREADVEPARPIEVVCFTEEEGQRFADGLLGSSVAAGVRTVEEALALEDAEGVTLEAALDDIGFRGEGRLDARDWDSWVELHVEQSTRLEAAGEPVGVVTDISGITHCHAVVEGEADHAGATPMADRTDALTAASEVILDVEEVARDAADRTGTAVGTVGSLDVRPNATNVVPGRVELGIDVRDVDYETMNEIVAQTRDSLDRVATERGVETSLERPFDVEPVAMDERVREAAHDAAEAAGLDAPDLHSGAVHDTMHVGRCTDAGMLFARSRDGVSHSPREWTDWDDCAAASRVLAGVVARLAR